MVFTQWKGIFPYLVSPVDEYGKVKEQVLRNLVGASHWVWCPWTYPLGSTGEFFYLDWEQRREIVRIVVEAAAGRVPVVAGVAASTNRDAVFQAAEFERLGVDGILGILNVYFPLNQDGIYDYFASIADAVSCQVVVYNNPKFTGFEIEIPTLKRLSQISNINYYKDASGNTGRLLQLSNVVGNDLKIFSASAHVPVFVMMLGGAGWMAGPACLLPRESVMLYELCEKTLGRGIQTAENHVGSEPCFQKYNLAACVKAGLQFQGFSVKSDSAEPAVGNRCTKGSGPGHREDSERVPYVLMCELYLNIILYPI
ncbi:MAG: dihydrodipicolinate synthase family protein [Enterocloster bolteae]